MPMTRSERRLALVLRLVGAMMMLAIVAVFLPRSWMDGIHQWLGLGALPEAPIVDYLARSVSGFYAVLGGVMWIIAGKQRRYAALITYLAMVFVLFGLILLIIDIRLDLPTWWILTEGPGVIFLGVLTLYLQART